MVARPAYLSLFLLTLTVAPSVLADTTEEATKPLSYWEPGKARAFVSTRIDGSVNYVKPLVALGYGKPHWIWIGTEAWAISTTEFGAAYAGVRASTPVLDIAYGVRDNLSYLHGWLTPAASHTAGEVRSSGEDGHTRYLATELEVSGLVPLLGGYTIWAINVDRILDAPHGMQLYEESLRVVMRKWEVSARVGFVYPFGPEGILKAGLLGEYVALPDRPSNVIRIGPAAVLTLTDHTELLAVCTVPVSSPDSLGVIVGTWAVLGLRYKWATGEKHPSFP